MSLLLVSILIFPGQGSKSNLINPSNPIVKFFIESANDILGYNLLELPADQLQDTKYSQVDMLVKAVIMTELYRACGKEVTFATGHSLGQYSACVAAGGLSFEECVKLVQERGMLMSEAANNRPGSMLACIGDVAKVADLVSGFTDLYLANYNSTQQVVVSGATDRINELMSKCKENGIRCVKLPVSGAFHSPFMDSANQEMNKLLLQAEFTDPTAGFISNKTGSVLRTKQELQEEFQDQIILPVYWTKISETIATLVEQESLELYEMGSGNTLGKLLEQNAGVKSTSIESLFDHIPNS